MRSKNPLQKVSSRYAAAVGLALAAQILRIPLDPPTVIPFITYVPFTVISAILGGFGPGLLTTLICTLEVIYFAVEPLGSFFVRNRINNFGIGAFVMSGVVASYLAERQRRSQQRLAIEGRRAEKASRLFTSIVEHSDDAIISKDLDGTILSWNQGAERIYGYEESEAVGRPISLLLPPGHKNEYPRFIEDLKAGKIVTHYETERVRKDGKHIFVSLTLSPVKEENRIVGASVIARDITERKLAEQEIRGLNEDLERRVAERTAQWEAANKELEAFAYSVSHDLRAPLRAIDGFSRILIEDFASQLPDDSRRYLDIVRTNAVHMGELIDDLLSFSRLGRQELKKQPVDMRSLLERVLNDLSGEQQGRRIHVCIGDLPPCLADPALLRQVFVNLLSNALKYTRGRETAQIEIGILAEGLDSAHAVTYFVRDNGAGFDMQYAGKLFGVFQRLHRAEEYEGTGVGLAIVHRIISRHGGRVWAEAAVGQGATFYFSLTDAAAPDATAEPLAVLAQTSP